MEFVRECNDNCNDNNTFNEIRDLEISPRYVNWTKRAQADYSKRVPELSSQLSNFRRSIPQCLLSLPLCFISKQLRRSVKSFRRCRREHTVWNYIGCCKIRRSCIYPTRGMIGLLLNDRCPEELSFVIETREEKKKLSRYGQQILRGTLSWSFSFLYGRFLSLATAPSRRCVIRVTD